MGASRAVPFLLATLTAIGCGGSPLPPEGGPRSPSAEASTRPVACAPPETAFVPAHLGVGGDPGIGRGSYRLCLRSPVVAEVQGAAECHWSDDRSRMVTLAGKAAEVDGRRLSPLIELWAETSVASLVVESEGSDVLGRFARPGSAPVVEVEEAGRDGRASFRGLEFEPVEGRRSDTAAGGVADGSVAWSCDAPPPLSAGYAPGELRLRIDAPVGLEATATASCWWSGSGSADRVVAVDASHDRAPYRDRWVSAALIGDPFGAADAPPEVVVFVTRVDYGIWGRYANSGTGVVERREPTDDPGRGAITFTDLALLPSADAEPPRPLDGSDATRTISGSAEWRCERPADATRPA